MFQRHSVVDMAALVLAGCALLLTGIGIKRELWPQSPPGVLARGFAGAPHVALAGQVLGPDSARVSIVEFGDYQCAFCAEAAVVLNSVRARFGDNVRLVYRHLPLEALHPHARTAALAAECAAQEGHFQPYHELLYQLQDSIGKLSWWEVARRAGMADSVAFLDCVREERHVDVVERDLAAARALNLRVTPTIIIGDRLFEGLPSRKELEQQLNRELRRQP